MKSTTKILVPKQSGSSRHTIYIAAAKYHGEQSDEFTKVVVVSTVEMEEKAQELIGRGLKIHRF